MKRHGYHWHMLACVALIAIAAFAFRRPEPTPEPPAAPRPQVQATGETREYTLSAAPAPWELRPGLVTDAYAYNGQVPGPEIRVNRGDRLKVTLVNGLDEPTTIHWHGVRVPAGMDGVPMISQDPVPPGGTFVYEFVAPDAGTFFYHSHFNADDQVDRGLYGPFVVEDPAAPAYRDVVLALDDWLLDASGRRLQTSASEKERDIDNELDSVSASAAEASSAGGGHMMDGGMAMGGSMTGGMGMMAHDLPNDINGRFGDLLAVNGKAGSAIAPVALKRGERVRARLINASNAMTHALRASDGRALKIISVDGTDMAVPKAVGTIVLSPAKRFDLLVEDDGKPWTLESVGRKGIMIAFASAGESEAAAEEWKAATLPALPPEIAHRAPDATYAIATDVPMGATEWTLNGKAYDMENPGAPTKIFAKDRWAKVRVKNASPMAHPMHLHGQFVRVIARNGQLIPGAAQEDTVVVRPNETVDLAVFTDNPGDWVLHCHNLEHEENGLMTKFRVQ